MYAHLYFDSGVKAGEVVRDIARLITSCTSSTASLSGLEFINTNSSSVVGGNSGWSLNTNSPAIPTSGTAASTADAYFILEAACTTVSKTKYCSIQVNCDFTGSDVTQSMPATVGGGATGVNLASVLDPGTATEMFSAGYTGASGNYTDVNCIVPSVDFSDGGIHIFADSTRILMFGKDGNLNTVLLGNAEFAETSTTTHHSLVPQCNFLVNEQRIHNGLDFASYRGETGSVWMVETSSTGFFQLNDATYSYNPNFLGKVRCSGWQVKNGNIPNYGGAYRGATYIANGTTYGSSNTVIGYGQQHNQGILGTASALSLFGTAFMDITVNDNTAYDNLWGRMGAVAYDSSGNPGLALRKVFWEVEPNWNNDVLDISSVSNFWRVAGGLGADGDTITIGSDVYVYLNMIPAVAESLGAFLIKRT